MLAASPATHARRDHRLKALIGARAARLRPERHRTRGPAGPLPGLLAAPSGTELPPRPSDRYGFAVTQQHAAFLGRLVAAGGVERVLEFGAGYSTWVLAQALAERGGGRLTTVEDAPRWCSEVLEQASLLPGVDVCQVSGPMRLRPTAAGLVRLYAGLDAGVAAGGPYDLVFIDGPFWREGREGVLHLALPHLRPGARIVLDDAGRPNERWVLDRWLRTCEGLDLELYDEHSAGKGIAVLRAAGPVRLTGSPGAVADSVLLAALLAVARHLWRTPPVEPRLVVDPVADQEPACAS